MAMDIYKGWPLDGSLNDNAKPKDAEGIVAGMAIKKDANGELVKADSTASEKAFFALESQSDFVIDGAKKMAYVIGNAVVLTDQYDITETYEYGTDVMADSGDPGKLTPWITPAPKYGYTDGFVERDGITYLKVILPNSK